MKHIRLVKIIAIPFLFIYIILLLQGTTNRNNIQIVVNPYEDVDWQKIGHYKAALHLHTLQSDGYHMPANVISAYKNAGYSIIALTDHDWNKPNARIRWGHVPKEDSSKYPLEPKPENYPANTTWPWSNYGAEEPSSLGMVGIQAIELTYRHHINNYFSDYGVWYDRTGTEAPYGGIVDSKGKVLWEDDILYQAGQKGGVAILNHPGLSHERSFWLRKPVEWYVERFRNHPANFLIGMEVTNTDHYADIRVRERYDEGLWDQLLTRFMPERPIWGFGTDDMHKLNDVPESYTVFILDELTSAAVREAMLKGQFYFTKSTRRINYFEENISEFPVIQSIMVNKNKNTIEIQASNYDSIKWISAPASLEQINDYKTSDSPWQSGRVIHVGPTFPINNTPHVYKYVRAEIIREHDGEMYRIFTNPFGMKTQN